MKYIFFQIFIGITIIVIGNYITNKAREKWSK